jgi:hypothetical protein
MEAGAKPAAALDAEPEPQPEPEAEQIWATGGWCIVCRACRSGEVCERCGVAPEEFSALSAELFAQRDENTAEFREAFEFFADGTTQQLHGPERVGAALRAMGMLGPRTAACDLEVESLACEFSLAGDGSRLSWEGFQALLLTRKRLENVSGETISAESEVLGVLRDYHRRVGDGSSNGSRPAGMTASELDRWLTYWEGLREEWLAINFDGHDTVQAVGEEARCGAAESAQRQWTEEDFAALACLDGMSLISEQDLADLKTRLLVPVGDAQHARAGATTGDGSGSSRESEGEPIAYREVVRRVFKNFGHADCVHTDRIVWIAGRTRASMK